MTKFCVINEESTIRINFDYFGTLSTSFFPLHSLHLFRLITLFIGNTGWRRNLVFQA